MRSERSKDGFTLIELLVVIAVISMLMAILLPILGKARVVAKRCKCQANLKQIASAWHMYLEDNDGYFYRGINVNHDFGGWKGTGGFAERRPLNKYLGLPEAVESDDVAEIFRCPSDKGGIFGLPPQELAYDYFGNSYHANLLLIGPTKIGVCNDERKELYLKINECLEEVNRTNVSNPAQLLLVGDNNWIDEWEHVKPPGKEWHSRKQHYNLAFLDGHVRFLQVHKGLYITDEYSVIPFEELYELAYSVQEEVTF